MSSDTIANLFWRHFEPVVAQSQEDRLAIHRIRYEVYCREFGYEREEDCPHQLEVDAYDRGAIHCLVRHRDTGLAAGCVRLVLPPPTTPSAPLPLERFCGESIDSEDLHPAAMPRSRIAEVSRLAVISRFRKRADELRTPIGHTAPAADSRHFPVIAMALSLAAAAMMGLTGRRYSYAMMEPRLARLLSRSGLNFARIGRIADYHGLRAPYTLTLDKALREMRPELRALYQGIHEHFAPAVKQHMALRSDWTGSLARPTHFHANPDDAERIDIAS